MSERNYAKECKSLRRLCLGFAGLTIASTYLSYSGHEIVSRAVDNVDALSDISRECVVNTTAVLAQRNMKLPCTRESMVDFDRAGSWIADHTDEIAGVLLSVCSNGDRSDCPMNIVSASDVSSVVSDAYLYCPDRETYEYATSSNYADSTCAFVIVDKYDECDYSSRPTEIYVLDCALDYDMCGKVRVLVHEALHAVYCQDHPKDDDGRDLHDDWIYVVGDKVGEICRVDTEL